MLIRIDSSSAEDQLENMLSDSFYFCSCWLFIFLFSAEEIFGMAKKVTIIFVRLNIPTSYCLCSLGGNYYHRSCRFMCRLLSCFDSLYLCSLLLWTWRKFSSENERTDDNYSNSSTSLHPINSFTELSTSTLSTTTISSRCIPYKFFWNSSNVAKTKCTTSTYQWIYDWSTTTLRTNLRKKLSFSRKKNNTNVSCFVRCVRCAQKSL